MAYSIRDMSLGTLAAPTSTWNSSTRQFRAVRASTLQDIFKDIGSSTSTIRPIGIVQNKPRLGESAEIWLPGCISKIQVGTGGLTVGKNFVIAATGLAFSTGAAPTGHGSAMYGPVLMKGSSGDIISVSFQFIEVTDTNVSEVGISFQNINGVFKLNNCQQST